MEKMITEGRLEDTRETALLHLWINNIEGMDLKQIIKLKKHFGNVWKIYEAGPKALGELLSEELVRKLLSSKNMEGVKELYEALLEKGISIMYPEHSNYPENLSNIHFPPQLLYVRGRLKKCINSGRNIGVVGSRNPSIYGREICRYFSEGLAKRNINIISGLARGIDAIAHKAALDNGGYTVAVLGGGINMAYPAENIELFKRIEENGAIISEYGLDVIPNKWQFPIRNRIISGLSEGVLVVEARAKSGSLITADHALEQGRQVYAVPGRLMDKCCEGTNNLIRQGAVMVNSPQDILEDFDGVCREEKDIPDEEIIEGLSMDEQKIMDCLGLEPVYIDEIIQKTCLGVTNTISTLYMLEEKKKIKQPVRGYYIKFILPS